MMMLETDPKKDSTRLKRNKRSTCLVTVGILIVALLAFGILILFLPPPPVVEDIGLFADSDCVLSCWRGLRPNQSTMRDIKTFYAQNLTRTNTDIFDNGLTTFSALNTNRNYQVLSTFREDELVDIFLVANRHPSFDLQIDTILTTLGNPEHIRIGYGTASVVPTLYPYIELYYPELGYLFYADLDIQSQTDDTIELCVQADINIVEIHIVAPNPIQDMIADTVHFIDPELTTRHVNAVLSNLDTWTGYRCYTLSYTPFYRRD